MNNLLQIAGFTVAVSLMYTGVAQLLPQMESHPPATVELGGKAGPEELIPVGQKAFEGTCMTCHKLGESGRAPDLSNIGQRAHERAAMRSAKTGKPYTDVDYVIESMCKPADFVVDPYDAMPSQKKALDGGQMLAVAAYLQSLGGDATVTASLIDPLIRFGCITGGPAGAAAPAAASEDLGDGPAIFSRFCGSCHAKDDDAVKIGPSLFAVGARLKKGDIYEAILAPDASLAKGFETGGGVMKKQLEGDNFYQLMTPENYEALATFLSEKKGEE